MVTNKAAQGKKGALVAMIQGTKASAIAAVLLNIPFERRSWVTAVTLGGLEGRGDPGGVSQRRPGHRSVSCATVGVGGGPGNPAHAETSGDPGRERGAEAFASRRATVSSARIRERGHEETASSAKSVSAV